MNIYSFSSLFASLFCFVLGATVFIKRGEEKKSKLFAIACIITGLWTLFPFTLSQAPNDASGLLIARIIYLPAIFTAVIWLHFLYAAIKEKLVYRDKAIIFFGYLISLPFLFFAFNPIFISGVRRFSPHFSIVPGPLYIVFVATFALIFLLALAETFLNFKKVGGYRKNQLRFIFMAYVVGVSSGILHFGAAYFNKEPIPHDLLLIGYTGLFAYAILKYRLMDIKVIMTRTGIFVIVYTLVLGIPFILSMITRDFFVLHLGTNWWLGPFMLLTIFATIGPFVYIYLQRRTETILLREQRVYQENLKSAARELAHIHKLKRLLNMIVHIVTKTVHISHSVIYLIDENSHDYILKATRNLKEKTIISIPAKDPLITWFTNSREPLVYEEVNRKAEDSPDSVFIQLSALMKQLHATVIVPGFLNNRLIGFLILGEKRLGGFYTSQDLDTFTVLANQAALAIENAMLYENMEDQVRQRTNELVDTQKQLIQAEKLATIGTLAGGVAHEINNPLTAILTNVQMLLLLNTTLDKDSRESLELVEEATKRCRTIVQKLMTYAKKPLEPTTISKVDMELAIRNVVDFLGYQLNQDNITIVTSKKGDIPLLWANRNELEQVLTNLILNSRDAIKNLKKAGKIWITLSHDHEWIIIDVKDEGTGIPQDILAKIFDPFFTTKEVGKGVGLGLSICQSIIEKHKGTVRVESEPNKGTTFTVKLPKEKIETPVT
jgi:signal transduction histidine kinase